MADRRWTVMVVPHGSDSPRSFSISERAVRAAYTRAGFRLAARDVRGDWSVLWLRKRNRQPLHRASASR